MKRTLIHSVILTVMALNALGTDIMVVSEKEKKGTFMGYAAGTVNFVLEDGSDASISLSSVTKLVLGRPTNVSVRRKGRTKDDHVQLRGYMHLRFIFIANRRQVQMLKMDIDEIKLIKPAVVSVKKRPKYMGATTRATGAASAAGNARQKAGLTPPPPARGPSDLLYSNFAAASNAKELTNLIKRGKTQIFLKAGNYRLKNPITLSGRKSFIIHGGDRMNTKLSASDENQPLFLVKDITGLHFAGVSFYGKASPKSPAILFNNSRPISFSMIDGFMERTYFQIKGPGTFTLQSCSLKGNVVLPAPVEIDHPQADFLMIGGNLACQGNDAPPDSTFHLWQKKGRLRVYGTGVQNARGRADFRIDSASLIGPHVIANIRSEGTNRENNPTPSCFLYVPTSQEKVDVVLKNCGGSWPKPIEGIMADYSAAGTLWMIGNNGQLKTKYIFKGNAPNATLVAFGNLTHYTYNPSELAVGKGFFRANCYDHRFSCNDQSQPWVRQVSKTEDKKPLKGMPPVPSLQIPLPIKRPVCDKAMLGSVNVKDRPYGATGDGKTDDHQAIQQALNDSRSVYLPAGTYRITQPLGLVHSAYGGVNRSAGGWIAGAGSDKTTILCDPNFQGPALATEGFAYGTIQGITFKAAPWSDGSSQTATVDLENKNGIGHATQEIAFHDCHFIGGYYALGIGTRSMHMCSENMMVGCTFQDAKFGCAVGNFNALANIVYDGTFKNNYITAGQSDNMTGGTVHMIHANITGTKTVDLKLKRSAQAVMLFHGVRSDTPVFVNKGYGGDSYGLLLEQCTFQPRSKDQKLINFGAIGGVTLIDSELGGSALARRGMASNYGLDIRTILKKGAKTSGSNDNSPWFSIDQK